MRQAFRSRLAERRETPCQARELARRGVLVDDAAGDSARQFGLDPRERGLRPASLSPAASADSTCLTKVRMRLTRAPLISARLALRRMRFFACGVFAIFECLVTEMKRARPRTAPAQAAPSTLREARGQAVSAGTSGSRRSSGPSRRGGESARRNAARLPFPAIDPPLASRNSRARRRAGHNREGSSRPPRSPPAAPPCTASASRSRRGAGDLRRRPGPGAIPARLQRLADIDVAEAGDDPLVEQQRLDRRGPARERARPGRRRRSRRPSGSGPIAGERLGSVERVGRGPDRPSRIAADR